MRSTRSALRRLVASGTVGLAVIAAVSACTDTGADTPVPGDDRSATVGNRVQAEDPATAAIKAREKARAVFGVLRMMDPCALLDPAAAQSATDTTPEDPVPGEGPLSRCDLSMVADGDPSWMFTVDIGITSPAATRQDREQKTIGGEEFWMAPDGFGCSGQYVVNDDLADDVVIEVAVVAPITLPDVGPSCDVLTTYLEQTAPLIASPPVRSNATSGLRVPLADKDPCAAVPAALTAVGMHGDVEALAPYECAARASSSTSNSDASHISVSYKFRSDPRKDVPETSAGEDAAEALGATVTAVTVNGHAGSALDQPDYTTCTVDLLVDETVTAQINSVTTRYQVVSVEAPDCETAKTAAAAVLDTLA